MTSTVIGVSVVHSNAMVTLAIKWSMSFKEQ